MSKWLACSLKAGLGDPGSSQGWVRQFLPGLLPLTQVYEIGSNPAMDEHPIHGGVKISPTMLFVEVRDKSYPNMPFRLTK